MEPSPPLYTTKICKMVREFLFTVSTGVSKSMITFDLNFLMKRGKIVVKVLNDIVVRHHTALSCISHDVNASFVSPREYEFSCSHSPSYQPYVRFHVSSRHKPKYRSRRSGNFKYYKRSHAPLTVRGDVVDWEVDDVAVESPLVDPLVRRVRITDSPFSLNGECNKEDCHVDKAAEEFIRRFYKELRSQKLVDYHR
ncbi:hypothetical protein HS088_TW09G01293 [Tripterygium wilfordii]|uniref:Avr9/Cf-9 rapidly elicited protein n=1 Tax=Tripterygium wilfordii TaxID=458696 RepID=A0A7J7DAE6_TRIWF|nr:uncharacterized protein LOC120006062 [Tripterygium wilfordii]KAF5743228.1 hypothetical protein HS088_TW09G01293 [Tripterygium wilfordii]